MKHFSKYFILFIAINLLLSCKKQLVEDSKSISAETFYNTAAEVQTGVNAIYQALRANNAFGNLYPAQVEAYTDYSYGKGSYSMLTTFQGLDGTNITRAGQIWDQLYLSIRNANLVIANTPNGKSISQADKDKYIGEAKFLRGFAYFFLVRNWGGVILRDEVNMKELDVPRTSAETIYNFIIDDLTFASEKLPDVPSVAGRPSKWAALSVLADVHFYNGDVQKARNASKAVIDAKKYKLIEVQTANDYDKIYGPDVVSTTEEVFYLKYARDNGQGWTFMQYPHHPGDPYYNGVGIYGHYTDSSINKFYKSWNKNDLRKAFNWFPFDIGMGLHTMLNRKFKDPGRVYQGANDYPLYRYADVLLLYAEADARANNTVTADAMEKLNMVHRRAYGYPTTEESPVDFKVADYNLTTFLDLVLLERGYETQYESKRWLDLKRTGKVKQIIQDAYNISVLDKHLLWPIPASELNFNKALNPTTDQNPGY